MHKIINKKSIQKITAIIIIMVMCNFIMSTKVLATATRKWMSIKEYLNINYSSMDIYQNVYDKDTSPAVKKIRDSWGVSAEDAIKILKNHEDDSNTLEVVLETQDTGGTTYKINTVSINLTDEEKNTYEISTDSNGNATVDTSSDGSGGTTYKEGENYGEDFGVLFKPLANLIQGVGDAVNRILQSLIIGEDTPVFYDRGLFSNEKIKSVVTQNPVDPNLAYVEVVKDYIDTFTGKYGLPDIKLTPAEIFAGNVSALDANFFETREDHNNELGGNGKSIINQLKGTVSKWYVALRNIAIVGLLSVLLYIGIRIVVSSSVSDKAKYKQFFIDWVVALCLIFFMHYIMAFTMTMSETVTDVIAGETSSQGRIKQVNIRLINTNGSQFSDGVDVVFSSNFTGVARIKADYASSTLRMGYSILYIALTVYTAYFSFVYLKRLLMLAFFTMIAPMVALTYPLDKMKDGKAQAFNYWFKEYMFYALLQPLHMLLYTVFVSSALSIAANNLLYAIVALAFIVPAEKIVKQMFGIKGNTEDKLGGFAGGALASQAFNMIKKGPPPPQKNGEKGGTGGNGSNNNIRTSKNPGTPSATTTLASTTTAGGVNNGNQTGGSLTGGSPAGGSLTGGGATGGASIGGGTTGGSTAGGNQTGGNPFATFRSAIAGGASPISALGGAATVGENQFQNFRRQVKSRVGKAASDRYKNAGGAKGIAKGAGKMLAKGYGKAFTTLGMGALGLGVGMVGGDMGDTLKGLGAGMGAGYATGGKLNQAVANIGDTAVGSFAKDVLYGDDRAKHDFVKSYMNNREVRERLVKKNPNANIKQINEMLRQRAEMSYDSGVSDEGVIDRAVQMKEDFDAQNPTGATGANGSKGDNYNRVIAYTQLAGKYSDDIFDDPTKEQSVQKRLADDISSKLRKSGQPESKANNAAEQEAQNAMSQIRFLKNK